jgi:hypothetical protein
MVVSADITWSSCRVSSRSSSVHRRHSYSGAMGAVQGVVKCTIKVSVTVLSARMLSVPFGGSGSATLVVQSATPCEGRQEAHIGFSQAMATSMNNESHVGLVKTNSQLPPTPYPMRKCPPHNRTKVCLSAVASDVHRSRSYVTMAVVFSSSPRWG